MKKIEDYFEELLKMAFLTKDNLFVLQRVCSSHDCPVGYAFPIAMLFSCHRTVHIR
jgi:hypothetical protein